MWLFLASECLLFGGLITTYLLYKHPLDGPDAQRDLRHPVHVDVVVRAADELAHHGAGRVGHRAGRSRPAPHLDRRPPPLLGATFIAGQVYEFTVFYREGLGFTTSRFCSAFYTLTGFHGVHVTVGIIMLVSLLFLSLPGQAARAPAETVEIVGLYWHFVDVVWIVIFAVVYLIP